MCFQEIEIYTCTHEIPPVDSKDFDTVFCTNPISERGEEGRFKAMRGAPHKLTEFPVYCEEGRKSGRAGAHCPEFDYERTYKTDPHGRTCLEHARGPTEEESAIVDEERQKANAQWKRNSDRSRAEYTRRLSMTEQVNHISPPASSAAPLLTTLICESSIAAWCEGTARATAPSDAAEQGGYDGDNEGQPARASYSSRRAARCPGLCGEHDEAEHDESRPHQSIFGPL
ncbi:hypothetical protein BDY17DRAFT_20753 [Neohortaea acidophila]|uniref:Uncharacterized protein n=1 Tax=Neohortaea acidophila TaxID=245834 RepID=A0A6A6Q7I0_9PEZI|nr:uncharacterized protein BDY17DRAFT_20753 [Neohortaea acidophila]KAF2487906.1 hypothetical protein BDY17DRAFT_20753 [Neohortaea acidophila]